MKGNYTLILKNGTQKKFRYLNNAIKSYFKEYGVDLKNMNKLIIGLV